MGKNVVIGQRVKAMREDKKLSIEEVAERSGLNVEQIRKIEEHEGLVAVHVHVSNHSVSD